MTKPIRYSLDQKRGIYLEKRNAELDFYKDQLGKAESAEDSNIKLIDSLKGKIKYYEQRLIPAAANKFKDENSEKLRTADITPNNYNG